MKEFNSDTVIASMLSGYAGKSEGVEIKSSDKRWCVKHGDCTGSCGSGSCFEWKRKGKTDKLSNNLPQSISVLIEQLKASIGESLPSDLSYTHYQAVPPKESEHRKVRLGDLAPGAVFINGASADWEGEWYPNLFRIVDFVTKVKGAKGCKQVSHLLPKEFVFCIPRHAKEERQNEVVAFPADMEVVIRKDTHRISVFG